MNEPFKTRILVTDAKYDLEQKSVVLFITIKMTGEKRVLVIPKDTYRYHESKMGDFPDAEMYRFADLIKGRELTWEFSSDVDENKMTPEVMQKMVSRVGQQFQELQENFGSDESIMGRRAEDLIKIDKKKAQNEALERIKKRLLEQ